MRRLTALLTLLAALTGLTVTTAPAAFAACSGPLPQGAPLFEGAGEEPMIARLGLRRVWELSTGTGVRVGVVDSGVDARTAKLTGALEPSTDFRPGPGNTFDVSSPGTGEDCENHGTPIAGIIAARPVGDDRVVGVAPDATIVPFRFDGDVGNAPDVMIAGAIRAAADQKVGVLNLSFAVGRNNGPIRDAVQYAVDRDVVVVAAAGNENESQPGVNWFPAAYPGVLAVASLDPAGQPGNASNRGPWVGIAAPGEGITAPSSGGGYTLVTGTSFATAIVSGVAALVRSRYPTMAAKDVVQRLRSTAVSLTGGQDERTGAGAVDPYAALTAVDVAPPETALPSAAGTAVRVLPVPTGPDLLGPAGRIAAAITGIVLAVAAVVGLGGLATRRFATRQGRGGPVDRYAPPHKPLEPVPDNMLG